MSGGPRERRDAYYVQRDRRDWIESLVCECCGYKVFTREWRRPGDKSGAPRYCRSRAAMLRHLRDTHGPAPKAGAGAQATSERGET